MGALGTMPLTFKKKKVMAVAFNVPIKQTVVFFKLSVNTVQPHSTEPCLCRGQLYLKCRFYFNAVEVIAVKVKNIYN